MSEQNTTERGAKAGSPLAGVTGSALPCVGCGELVSEPRVTDRDGWWHPECEQKAWEESELGAAPIKAPFRDKWRAEKNRSLAPNQ